MRSSSGLLRRGSDRTGHPRQQRTEKTIATWNAMDGQQAGDPAKLAAALVTLADHEDPPLRWVAGADAVAGVAQVDAYRELSSNLTVHRRPTHTQTPLIRKKRIA